MTTGKTIALTRQTFVGKVIFLLFNTLSRFVIAILPRTKHLLILWLQSPSALILEPRTSSGLRLQFCRLTLFLWPCPGWMWTHWAAQSFSISKSSPVPTRRFLYLFAVILDTQSPLYITKNRAGATEAANERCGPGPHIPGL